MFYYISSTSIGVVFRIIFALIALQFINIIVINIIVTVAVIYLLKSFLQASEA